MVFSMVTNFVRRVQRVAAAGLVIATVSVAVGGSGSAAAENQICDQFGSTTIGGSYVVMNNRFNSRTATQCINVTDTGFAITKLDGGGRLVGYPAVYLGCHFGNCSPGSSLPMQVSNISSATSSVDFSYVDGGSWDAAYDIWLDPAPQITGRHQMEIMIFFNKQPFSTSTPDFKSRRDIGNTMIGGRSWEVWQAGPLIIYTPPSPINAWNFSVLDFINDVRSRGGITDAWYLDSIQAGFECASGCVGLAVNSFSAAVN